MDASTKQIEDMHIWAWIGPDDGPEKSGVVGIKQARSPAGYIPMVSCIPEKMSQEYIRKQMIVMAGQTGVKRFLVRYKFDAIEEIVESPNVQ